MNQKVFKADLIMLLVAFIWGSAFVAQRASIDTIGPFSFNAIRFGLGALSLFPIYLFTRKKGRPFTSKVIPLSIIAGVALFGGASLQQIGIAYTTAGKAGFITGLYVLLIPLAGIFLGHKIGINIGFASLFSVVGLFLLTVTEELTFEKGDIIVFIATFFWTFHVLFLGAVASKHNAIAIAIIQFATCSLLSTIAAISTESFAMSQVHNTLIPLLYGSFASVGIGYTLQIVAQKYSPPTHAAIILSLEAVCALLAGWLLLNETITFRGGIGALLMLAGMLFAQLDCSFVTHFFNKKN